MDEVQKRQLGVLLIAVGLAFVAGYAIKKPVIDQLFPSRAPLEAYSVVTVQHLVSGPSPSFSGVSSTFLTTIEIKTRTEVAIGDTASIVARFDQFEVVGQQPAGPAVIGSAAMDDVPSERLVRLKTAKAPLKITMNSSKLKWEDAFPIRTIAVGHKLRVYQIWSPGTEATGVVTVSMEVEDELDDPSASTGVTSQTFIVRNGVRVEEIKKMGIPLTFRVLGEGAIPDTFWAWLTIGGSMLAFVGAITLLGWGKGLLRAAGILRAAR